MSDKDFFIWNKIKILLNRKDRRVFFREREIWLTYLGKNIGFEQNGAGREFLRPVLIIRKFNKDTFLSLPLTKSNKKGKCFFNFQFKKGIISTAILSQIRMLDARRLKYKIGGINEKTLFLLKRKIKRFFA